MTGHKKIVGLWRDSATSSDATETPAAEAATAEPMGADEAGESRAEPSTEREWLDMSAVAESDEADEAPADTPWRDRPGPTLMGLLAPRSAEPPSELQSLMRISHALSCFQQ